MRRLLLSGIAVFAIALIAGWPARVGYSWFAPEALRLSALSGTLWNGRAAQGSLSGLYLDDLNWSLRPASLLRGRLAWDVTVNPAGGFFESVVEVGLTGDVDLRSLSAAMSIQALQAFVSAPGIDGQLQLQFDNLRLVDGLPVSADGQIDIVGLVIRGLSQAPLGNFRAVLASSDRSISGSIEDIDASIDIAGSVRIGADRTYLLSGLIAPTASTPQSVAEQLRFLGSANERGQRQFRFEGRL